MRRPLRSPAGNARRPARCWPGSGVRKRTRPGARPGWSLQEDETGVLAVALDGDESVAMGAPAAGAVRDRDRAGRVIAVDLAKRDRLAECVRAAIGAGGGGAAARAFGEAAVDAVSVRVVGNDENLFFGLCRRHPGQDGRDRKGSENRSHEWLARMIGRMIGRMRAKLLRIS